MLAGLLWQAYKSEINCAYWRCQKSSLPHCLPNSKTMRGEPPPFSRTVVALGGMDRLKRGRQGKLDPFSPVADRSQHHR